MVPSNRLAVVPVHDKAAAFLESNKGLHPAIYAAIPRCRCPGGSAVIEMKRAQLETANSVMSVTAVLTAGL